MVTGDHQLTATAIAKQIGLIDDHTHALAASGGSAASLRRNTNLRRSMTTSNISGADYEVREGDPL
jgi:magnesium-transporting ATPase (P-type)